MHIVPSFSSIRSLSLWGASPAPSAASAVNPTDVNTPAAPDAPTTSTSAAVVPTNAIDTPAPLPARTTWGWHAPRKPHPQPTTKPSAMKKSASHSHFSLSLLALPSFGSVSSLFSLGRGFGRSASARRLAVPGEEGDVEGDKGMGSELMGLEAVIDSLDGSVVVQSASERELVGMAVSAGHVSIQVSPAPSLSGSHWSDTPSSDAAVPPPRPSHPSPPSTTASAGPRLSLPPSPSPARRRRASPPQSPPPPPPSPVLPAHPDIFYSPSPRSRTTSHPRPLVLRSLPPASPDADAVALFLSPGTRLSGRQYTLSRSQHSYHLSNSPSPSPPPQSAGGDREVQITKWLAGMTVHISPDGLLAERRLKHQAMYGLYDTLPAKSNSYCVGLAALAEDIDVESGHGGLMPDNGAGLPKSQSQPIPTLATSSPPLNPKPSSRTRLPPSILLPPSRHDTPKKKRVSHVRWAESPPHFSTSTRPSTAGGLPRSAPSVEGLNLKLEGLKIGGHQRTRAGERTFPAVTAATMVPHFDGLQIGGRRHTRASETFVTFPPGAPNLDGLKMGGHRRTKAGELFSFPAGLSSLH